MRLRKLDNRLDFLLNGLKELVGILNTNRLRTALAYELLSRLTGFSMDSPIGSEASRWSAVKRIA